MAYKNAQPKIADTLSVFVEQIGEIEKSTNSLKKISEDINVKMDLFYKYEPKVDFSALEKINEKYIRTIEATTKKMDTNLSNYLVELEKTRLHKDTFFFNFSMITAVMVLITLTASGLAVHNYYKSEHFKENLIKSETLRKQNEEELYNFIMENRLKDKYIKWKDK